ncbi:MAG: RNA polymerase sigma factor [Lachnospiraceae bacterium]|nr:RNA polymerase sigma factor [Lachnospiraceae bacterium]
MQKKSWRADDSLKEKIKLYSPMVYHLAYSLVKNRADADDIHQEVFIKYISKSPCFESAEHEKAWLIKVTTNQCKNWWKAAWRQKIVSLSEYEEEGRELAAPQDMHGEEAGLIDKVKSLSWKYRVVIHLYYYEELSVEEIAKSLELKASTVRTHLTRARRKLSELLKEEV